ncbi:uncharacterized protein C11orf97 homolog [Melanerpes formicivorus]|uniref:uncharacterized protein C11orf97 homolog n=1 Tax=Melanerpes formicivorus TaxID=211600 RepID=UPI0035902162
MAEGGAGVPGAQGLRAARRGAAAGLRLPPVGGMAEPDRPGPPPLLWGRARPAPICPGVPAATVRAASGEQPSVAAEEAGGGQPWKTSVYVEPSRRVKEILQEELNFRTEACHVKHPAAVALEGIWSVRKNLSLGSLKPVSPNRNGLLLQPQFYSRHARMKTEQAAVIRGGVAEKIENSRKPGSTLTSTPVTHHTISLHTSL